MIRTMPVVQSEEIELYIRTYYSLLRSSAPIRIRSLEETHAAMKSSLHQLADSAEIDMSALVYAALRLPECIVHTRLVILGQMDDVFQREGYTPELWQPVKARARRRKFYFEPQDHILAAYIASVSDIDDLIPCLTTLQIEWNKLHDKLANYQLSAALQNATDQEIPALLEQVRQAADLSAEDFAKLSQVWRGNSLLKNFHRVTQYRLDLHVTVLGSGLSDYRRSVQCWWGKVRQAAPQDLSRRPIYFVSSNAHSLANLLSGYAWEKQAAILEYLQEHNPEGLWPEYERLPETDNGHLRNFLYYTSRMALSDAVNQQAFAAAESAIGITRLNDPHCLDVEAQVIELNKLDPARFDDRLQGLDPEGLKLLRESDALIFNIDYPLGMAAYHIFSQVSTAVGRILGVYILGKAATLNGRVGDVMIPNVVYDEHSRNSYLFRNDFTAQDVAPHLNFGTVFDNQKAVTVRGTILQNRSFMHVFYEEGYTDIEMEAGPYLSSIYEDVYPKRYPIDEIVNLFINAPYDIGVLHYASDTPISRRQSLLSKSLSYFGVDATYATALAVLRKILTKEIARLQKA
ncbi:MAG: hypothetical protein KF832_17770 [Caldilineaceae bacterium]|nr:hypothetical protein [Caldilineaceae bacterium]